MKDLLLRLVVSFTMFFALIIVPLAIAGTVTYTYDDASRLIKADYGEGSVVTYTYDSAGNLLKKQVVAPAVGDTVEDDKEEGGAAGFGSCFIATAAQGL